MAWQPATLPGFGADADRYLQTDGCLIHYLDSGGTGRPVVFLHGIDQNVRSWEVVLPRIRGPYRFIVVDQRGHGLSDLQGVAYRPGHLLADLRALIESLGLERPLLVGHSLGGWVAMALAGSFPDLPGGLVVGDAPPAAALEISPLMRFTVLGAHLMDLAGASWANEEHAYMFFRLASPAESSSVVWQRIRQQLRLRPDGRLERARSPEIALAIQQELANTSLWPLLPEIKCPTLVIRAQHSEVLFSDVARRMVRTIPNARLALVENSYHSLHLFQPRRFGEQIDAFLREVA